MDASSFAKMAPRTSLNLSPLFDHAVVVQKSPGRFLCVGRDRSHQEADQVISIISLIPHSGRDLVMEKKKKKLNLSKAFPGIYPLKNNRRRVLYIQQQVSHMVMRHVVNYSIQFCVFIILCSSLCAVLSLLTSTVSESTAECWA